MRDVSEEQARKMRCCGPFPCGVPDDSNGINSVQRLCVAFDCMAWDWGERQHVENPDGKTGYYVQGGRCGLARR